MRKEIIAFLLMAGLCLAVDAQIIDSSNAVQSVTASSAYKAYVDSLGSNPDFGLRLCGAGQKYVDAAYAANIGGTYQYVTLSKNLTAGSSATLVYTSQTYNGSCSYTPIDAYAFSQFKDFTRTPPVSVSAFPGRIHLMYSSSQSGTSPSFVFLDFPNGWLQGSYSTTQSFSQASGNVTANVGSISFVTDAGTLAFAPSDASWGLSNSTGRSMLIALCNDTAGDDCTSGTIVNSSAQLPAQLPLGFPANDQQVYTRYIVVDGLASPAMCVGTDMSTGMTAATPVYYGYNSSVDIAVTNNGNVAVTTPFDLYLNITGPGGYNFQTAWVVAGGIGAGATVHRYYNWTANGPSGTYNFSARADPENAVKECGKLNNNATQSVTVTPVYTVHTALDGNETSSFPVWGRPYNLTVWVTSSDNATLTGTTFVLTETNGLNPFVPTQIWNESGTPIGVRSWSAAQVASNASGYARLAVIPTCNFLYSVNSSEGADAYVGNYSIVLNVYQGASPVTFLFNSALTQNYVFSITNNSCADPGWVNDKQVINSNKYVLPVYDWLYQVYSIMKKLVVP